MKLKEFIVAEAIIPDLQASDRDQALRELTGALAAAGALPTAAVEEVVAALIKREQNGSTGFGKGVAVPHVKHPKVKKMVGAIGRSPAGVDFAALDHQPVHIVFLLLSPENQPQQHLQAMNIVFGNLQKDMFRRFLRQSATRQDIIELLDEADQENKAMAGKQDMTPATVRGGGEGPALPLEQLRLSMAMVWRDIVVSNSLGLHARPAMQFVDTANQFRSKVTVSKQGPEAYQADGKSVMQMIILAATKGTALRIGAEGDDAEAAVAALAQLFEDKFGEE